MICSFKGDIFQGRWGTVAFSVPELLRIRRILSFAWNRDAFLHGEDLQAGSVAATDMTKLVNDVDAAIRSSFWWAWLQMVEALCCGLRAAFAWIEGCPCHSHLLKSYGGEDGDMPGHVRVALASCPMRTRRAAELSCGEFLSTVGRAFDLTAAELSCSLQEASTGLSVQERSMLLDEFDLGRSHLACYFTMKVSHWNGFPWEVARLSHFDADIARDAAQQALESLCCHPILSAGFSRFKGAGGRAGGVQLLSEIACHTISLLYTKAIVTLEL